MAVTVPVNARYWIGTTREDNFLLPSPLPSYLTYARGQLEAGHDSGYLHYQWIAVFAKPQRLSAVRKYFPGHWEPTKSAAANKYVFKQDTAVEGTQFELGSLPIQRNSKTDWDIVRSNAQTGRLDLIPADIYVRCYNQLKRISSDHCQPVSMVREVNVYWGKTGTGKSRTAWESGGMDAYAKDPRTKWWDGYHNQEVVIIDEFRGAIDVSHILRWTDRYPVRVETKGSTVALAAKTIYFTSNIDPRTWYPELDSDTVDALIRRLNITHYNYFLTF